MVPPPVLTLVGTIYSTEATVCNNVALLSLIARVPEQLILRSAAIATTEVQLCSSQISCEVFSTVALADAVSFDEIDRKEQEQEREISNPLP
jgi:hypothetical protein